MPVSWGSGKSADVLLMLPPPSGAKEDPSPPIGAFLGVQLWSACGVPRLLPAGGTKLMLMRQHWLLGTLGLALLTCCPAGLCCTAGSAKYFCHSFCWLPAILFSWGHSSGSFGLLFLRFGFNHHLTSLLLILLHTCCAVVILLWAVF